MNKYFILILLILTALANPDDEHHATVEGHHQLKQNTTCETKNSFLKKSHDGIRNLLVPEFDSEHCGHEWETFGTCCCEHSLLDLAEKESDRIDKATNKLIANIEGFSKDFQKLFKAFKDLGHQGKEIEEEKIKKLKEARKKVEVAKRSRKNYEKNVADSNFKKIQKNDSFASKVIVVRRIAGNEHAVAFSKSLISRIISGEFRNETKACWKEMMRLKAASYCSFCSARADVFFIGKKVLIDDDACNGVISKCQDSFSMLLSFFSKFETVSKDIISTLEGTKAGHDEASDLMSGSQEIGDFTKSMKKIQKVSAEAQRDRIPQLMRRYLNAPENQKPQEANPLCSMLVSVTKKTVIESLADLLNYNTQFMKGLTAYIDHHMDSYIKIREERIKNEEIAKALIIKKKMKKIAENLLKKRQAQLKRNKRQSEIKPKNNLERQSQSIHVNKRDLKPRSISNRVKTCSKMKTKSRIQIAAPKNRQIVFRRSSVGQPQKLRIHRGQKSQIQTKKCNRQPSKIRQIPVHSSTKRASVRKTKSTWSLAKNQARPISNFHAKPLGARRKLLVTQIDNLHPIQFLHKLNLRQTIFFGDVLVVPPVTANIDSSYTSYFGATGTTGNEVSRHVRHMPLNVTTEFP